jgi:KUP system potassium uptake protein
VNAAATDTTRSRALILGALGVVYGDIGTSPLYAIKECFFGPHPVEPTPANVTGVLSLVVWTLILIVTVKYLLVVMRADNRGEGGILALTALTQPKGRLIAGTGGWLIVMLGLFGAALLYGDGVITPAISVLSATEGLSEINPSFHYLVIPATIAILVGLFAIQARGTGRVGAVFGPITLAWFVVIGALGLAELVRQPAVLWAVLPSYGVRFLLAHGWHGFLVLGSVFLVATGSEALYADMGHFGRGPIRQAWFAVVMPGLLLNYFGQGALLLADPKTENPFYGLAPRFLLPPLVILATAATIIASQALISGAFSLTRQAIQLGYLPRMHIEHTSATEIGQVYVGPVNWGLLVACVGVVIGFGSSTALAAAYGIAVATTMVITTLLLYVLAINTWKWGAWQAVPLFGTFLVVELAFLVANCTKIVSGGWFPLVMGGIVFTVLTTWNTGRQLLADRMRDLSMEFPVFAKVVSEDAPHRAPRTGVFMTTNADRVPPTLLRNLVHNCVLHERIVLLTVQTLEVPYAEPHERIVCALAAPGIWRVIARYGFMETPDVPRALQRCRPHGLELELEDTTFFLGREIILPNESAGMAWWREALFAYLSQNSQRATMYFKIPPALVIEMGSQIEI